MRDSDPRGDWIVFLAFLLTGLIGASSFLIYRVAVPLLPPWDVVIWEVPFIVTLSELIVLIVPGLLVGMAFVVSASEYLDDLDEAQKAV
jgi:uncharacterized protein (DUF983 family)